jgi:hypothetical protein
LYEGLWRRPKDLTGKTVEPASAHDPSPAWEQARSFGRAQAVEWLRVPCGRSLRKSTLPWQHPLSQAQGPRGQAESFNHALGTTGVFPDSISAGEEDLLPQLVAVAAAAEATSVPSSRITAFSARESGDVEDTTSGADSWMRVMARAPLPHSPRVSASGSGCSRRRTSAECRQETCDRACRPDYCSGTNARPLLGFIGITSWFAPAS